MVLEKLPALSPLPSLPKHRLTGKIPLYLVMVVPLVIQILGAVAVVGWLAHRNGQQAIDNTATQLRTDSSNRIRQHLDDYLATPIQINRINKDAIELGLLDVKNFQTTGKYFWRQMQTFKVGYISFGSVQGDFIGVERTDQDKLLINEKSAATKNQLLAFATDGKGDRGGIARLTPDYNPRTEGWFTDAVQAGKPQWSSIYQWEDQPNVLSVSANYPLYDSAKRLIGVLSVDQILTQISDFLNEIKVSPTSKTYIVERSGDLVASSSTTEKPFQVVNGKASRLKAVDSQDGLIRSSAADLIKRFGSLRQIQQIQQLDYTYEGQRQFLLTMPWKDQYGLDWLIVVVVPEADFTAQLHQNTRNTMFSCAIALALATLIGIPTSRWIARQILQLSLASEALANGQLHQTLQPQGITELETLAQSFNRMAQQLRESFATLEHHNEILEQRVEERTASLQAAQVEQRRVEAERRRTEESMRVSQEKFAKAFSASPDFITISNLKTGRFLEVNESFLNASGYTREEVVGKTVFDLGAWGNRQDRTRLRSLLAEQGRVRDLEVELRKKTGEIMMGLLSGEIIDLEGEPCLLAVTKDITAAKRDEVVRKRAEAAIRESQKNYRDLVETTNSIILRLDPQGNVTFMNRYAQEFFGYQEQDILGLSVLGTLITEREGSRQRLNEWLNLICSNPAQHQDAESENLRSNGEKVWVKWSNRAILNEQGKLVEILSVGFNITDRKLAEDALQEKEQYLRLVLNNIPQQVFWKDTNLTFLGCNQNWAEAAQLNSPEEIIGLTDYDLLSDPAIADQFRAQDRQIIATDTPQLHIIAPKVQTSKGETVWLDICKVPIHDRDHKVIGILGVVDDITQRKQAEEALKTEQDKSESLLLNVLPRAIADRLKQSLGELQERHSSALIAESFEEVTVLFADIVNFTTLSANVSAADLVGLLNRVFLLFDDLSEKHNLEKIKTIGDAYMVVGGLPNPRTDHAEAIADMALEIQREINQILTYEGQRMNVRIGINTGPVIAGVIGKKKFTYDLWGDVVNTASRMEAHSIPGKIQVTEATYQCLKHRYILEPRGAIEVKGKGRMNTYWLIGKT